MAVEEKKEEKPEDKQIETEVDLVPPEVDLDAPTLEDNIESPKPKINPLSPGGVRFEQVYARGKQAERDLVKERELRIAAEAKLEVLSGKKEETVDADTEYTWSQLEAFIAEGRITRADANAHRESIIEKRLAKKIKGEFTNETTTATRTQALTNSIADYVKIVPDILKPGSVDRERLDEEFDFLASVQGVDTSKITDAQRVALQLTALRTVYGPVDALVKRNIPPKGETHQGLPGGTRPAPRDNSDQALLDGLSKAQVAHYNKMFLAGRYPGRWKDVVEELKYVVPKKVRQ